MLFIPSKLPGEPRNSRPLLFFLQFLKKQQCQFCTLSRLETGNPFKNQFSYCRFHSFLRNNSATSFFPVLRDPKMKSKESTPTVVFKLSAKTTVVPSVFKLSQTQKWDPKSVKSRLSLFFSCFASKQQCFSPQPPEEKNLKASATFISPLSYNRQKHIKTHTSRNTDQVIPYKP